MYNIYANNISNRDIITSLANNRHRLFDTLRHSRCHTAPNVVETAQDRRKSKPFQLAFSVIFGSFSHISNILSANTAKPHLGSSTRTCVTAPTSLPFCIIGEPLIPCKMPPVLSISALSVTSMSKSWLPLPDRSTPDIFTLYFFTPVLSMLV